MTGPIMSMNLSQNNFWKSLDRPIKVLAPMAGYTDSAFRQICRGFGADVTITELVSADAIYHKCKNWYKDENGLWQSRKDKDDTLQLLQFAESERPLVIQLFGKYPEKFAKATEWITKNLKPDGIDINMGCPARKVVGSDHGAALMKYPELAAKIVKAVRENTDLPVSVKTRLGWDNPDQILEFAPVLYEAGIDAIIIHGRTYKQGFKGAANWENIYKVKKALPDLVVIGNGGVSSIADVNLSGEGVILDGFAIGQATFGRPWIFSKKELNRQELKALILAHAKATFETKGEFGLIEFRKHLLKYLLNFSGAKALRSRAVLIEKLEDIKLLITEL
jgi:tRNA-dihydrouridine synthase B